MITFDSSPNPLRTGTQSEQLTDSLREALDGTLTCETSLLNCTQIGSQQDDTYSESTFSASQFDETHENDQGKDDSITEAKLFAQPIYKTKENNEFKS